MLGLLLAVSCSVPTPPESGLTWDWYSEIPWLLEYGGGFRIYARDFGSSGPWILQRDLPCYQFTLCDSKGCVDYSGCYAVHPDSWPARRDLNGPPRLVELVARAYRGGLESTNSNSVTWCVGPVWPEDFPIP